MRPFPVTFFWWVVSSQVCGATLLDHFIQDIIETWKPLSPTVIFRGDLPELCLTTERILCLPNNNDSEVEALKEHVTKLHLEGKQGCLIFIGSNHGQLINYLGMDNHIFTKSLKQHTFAETDTGIGVSSCIGISL